MTKKLFIILLTEKTTLLKFKKWALTKISYDKLMKNKTNTGIKNLKVN